MGIVDLSKLGMAKVTREETTVVTDPKTQFRHQQRVLVTHTEPQPILNEEDAALLWEAEWEAAPKHLKKSGKVMCVISGRRFFADKKPVKPKEDKAGKDK